MKSINFFSFLVLCALTTVSCSKDEGSDNQPPAITRGIYVLNEGLFSQNNTMLTYYDPSTNKATTDIFANVNGSGLGDTGNDIIIYGGKGYIVMNGSSYLQVMNAATATGLKKIELKTGNGAPRMPRYAVSYRNKVYVSCSDGSVAVIDTSSLATEKYINVGLNPEQMVVVGDRLFVANSGGFTAEFDSTVSEIDLITQTETRKIQVGVNPGSITADEAGNVYVACTGNYSQIKPRLVKFNANTGNIVKSADTVVGKLRYHNGYLLVTGGYIGTNTVRALNTNDFAQLGSTWITDGTAIQMPYGLYTDPTTGDVFVTDAKNYTAAGEVFCFDKDGKKKYSFSVSPGVNPNGIAIWKQ